MSNAALPSSVERHALADTSYSRCPVCGQDGHPTRFRVVTTKPFGLDRCTRCGLVYAVPRPSPEELDAFYTGDYFSGGRGDLGYYAYDWADANAERMWGLVQQWDPRLGVVPHTLLDVGCAHGSFALTAQRDGWATAGVELAAEARERAAKRGLRMFSSLEDAHGSYGLITMMHVLEHLIDPMAGLTAARQLIDPNGLLLIELPHWGSLGRRVRGCRWSQLKPPAHINFFERRSLDIALQSAGWLTMRSATVHEHFIDVASAELRQRHLGRGFAYAAAASALEHMGVAGNLRVVASPR